MIERGIISNSSTLLRCCKDNDHSPQKNCCLQQLLANQEDFLSQKSILEETLEQSGHMLTLYPKYHCETNFIEQHWGAAKRIARLNCDYTFKGLKENIHSFLDYDQEQNAQKTIRKWFNRCYRYIDAYSQGNDAIETNEIIKKFSKQYRSHRRAL